MEQTCFWDMISWLSISQKSIEKMEQYGLQGVQKAARQSIKTLSSKLEKHRQQKPRNIKMAKLERNWIQ